MPDIVVTQRDRVIIYPDKKDESDKNENTPHLKVDILNGEVEHVLVRLRPLGDNRIHSYVYSLKDILEMKKLINALEEYIDKNKRNPDGFRLYNEDEFTR